MSERNSLSSGSRLASAGALDEILRRGLVRTVFQPLVDLDTGALFGFEALARGPEGSPLEHPAELFAAALAQDRVGELDHACQRAAVAGARRHGVEAPLTLFVNAEPDPVGFGPLPPRGDRMRPVVELKERALAGRLPELLAAVQRARVDGWGVSLDDVGADRSCLALMPVVRPDVIKLDVSRMTGRSGGESAAIAEAVCVQAERTGATVLAQGIETAEQLQQARALGATIGQGYHLGVPVAQPRRAGVTGTPLPLPQKALSQAWRTPFDIASARRPLRRGSGALLVEICHALEAGAAADPASWLLIRCLPGDAAPVFDADGERLALELSSSGMAGSGRRSVSIGEGDPLYGTWNVLAVGAGSASLVAARAHGRTTFDDDEFDFVVTRDRELVVECAQVLMLRIAAAARAWEV